MPVCPCVYQGLHVSIDGAIHIEPVADVGRCSTRRRNSVRFRPTAQTRRKLHRIRETIQQICDEIMDELRQNKAITRVSPGMHIAWYKQKQGVR